MVKIAEWEARLRRSCGEGHLTVVTSRKVTVRLSRFWNGSIKAIQWIWQAKEASDRSVRSTNFKVSESESTWAQSSIQISNVSVCIDLRFLTLLNWMYNPHIS